jgi:hypothetical protein
VGPGVFDDSRPIAVHDFSLRAFSGKTGAYVLLIVVFVVIAGLLLLLSVTRPGSRTLAPGLLTLAIGVGFCFPPVAQYSRRVRRVEVFPGGIRWHAADGTGQLPWDRVEAVYRTELVINGFRRSEIKLVSGGGQVTFDRSLDRHAELANLIQSRSADLLRPRKRQEAAAGGAAFGGVLVGQSGVSLDGAFLPWEGIARYGVRAGQLWIQPHRGGIKAVPLLAVPNYLVLLYLLGELAPPAVREASGVAGLPGT